MVLVWCSKPYTILVLSTSLPLFHATLMLAHTYQIPRLFSVPQICPRLLLTHGFVVGLKNSSHRFFFSWLDLSSNVTSSRRGSIPTYTFSGFIICIKRSGIIYLFANLSVHLYSYNWLKQLDRKGFVYGGISVPRSGSGPLQMLNKQLMKRQSNESKYFFLSDMFLSPFLSGNKIVPGKKVHIFLEANNNFLI